MDETVASLISSIAWPTVALIAIIILGPGGLLKASIAEITNNLLQLNASIEKFKKSSESLGESQAKLGTSLEWMSGIEQRLLSLGTQLERVRSGTDEIAINLGNRALEQAVPRSETDKNDVGTDESELLADEMLLNIRTKWDELVTQLRTRVGAEFDARSVGQMAWRLVDGRRRKPLAREDAELIENLHSQVKRFNRLHGNIGDILTHDVYLTFIRSVDKALAAL